jgi:hypothetical protein
VVADVHEELQVRPKLVVAVVVVALDGRVPRVEPEGRLSTVRFIRRA